MRFPLRWPLLFVLFFLFAIPRWGLPIEVSGTVSGPAGPLAEVDVDFFDSVTGVEFQIGLGDTTDELGAFRVDVPLGTYDIQYTPPLGSGVAGGVQEDVAISAPSVLPPVALESGFAIAMRILNRDSNPLPAVVARFSDNSDVRIFTPRNTSNQDGFIQTIVPQSGVPYTLVLRDEGGRGFADKEFVDFEPTGTTDLGEITMGLPLLFTGRTVRFIDVQPVAGVNIDVVEDSNGLELRLSDDLSAADGTFTIGGLSDGRYTIFFRPPGATGLSRKTLRRVRIRGSANFGNISLGMARSVRGRLIDSVGGPIEGIDFNFTDQALDEQVELNNDNSLADGSFVIETTDGVYTIDIRPSSSSPFGPKTLFDVLINQDIDLGDIVLDSVSILSGIVTDYLGAPVQGADLDVIDLDAGREVFVSSSNSDSAGLYSARLAPGSWDLVFTPPSSRPDLVPLRLDAVAVSGNLTLDIVLPKLNGVEVWRQYE